MTHTESVRVFSSLAFVGGVLLGMLLGWIAGVKATRG